MTTLEPKYALFNNTQEMLSAETLSGLLNQQISQVTCRPFESTNGFSSNLLYHVEADGQKLILKRLRPSVDWLAVISNDTQCRSIRVWEYGLLDRLQPYMKHGILAAGQDGGDFTILMRDVSPGLLNGRPLSPQVIPRMLDALARMHAMYWGDGTLQNDVLGLSGIDNKLSYIRPIQPEQYRHAPHIMDMIEKGRSALLDLVEPDVTAALQSLRNDHLPLKRFLEQLPMTLTHSDFRQDNLAFFLDTQELYAFDWQNAACAPPTDDVCWFVGGLLEQIDTHESYYQYYQHQLMTYLGERFDPDLWRPMLDVGCLVEAMTKGTWHAFFAVHSDNESMRALFRRSVDSYNEIVRKGMKWL